MAIPPVRTQGDSGHIQDHNDIGTELAARLPLSGGTLTGALNGTSATFTGTVSAATPTENSHAATKQYVDSKTFSIPGLGSAFINNSITITLSSDVIPYPNLNCVELFTVTFPGGRFSSPPSVSGGANRFRCHVNGRAATTTSVIMAFQNFDTVTLTSGSAHLVSIMAIGE